MMITSALAAPVHLSSEVEHLSAQIDALTPATCTATLGAAYLDLERLRPDDVDLADVAANGPHIAQRLFEARLALHAHLRDQDAAGTLTAGCLRSMRRFDLAGRYLADYLLEDAAAPGTFADGWLVAPDSGFTGLDDLRTGDILVTRGAALSSAGIAYMGRTDSQFSHNAMVYVDPDTRRRHTVEAYLELGALTQPLDRLLAHGIDRVVVLRHPDADLAARAAKAAYQRVKRGPKIDYDADFDFEDHDALFCSEIPTWAFALAGSEQAAPFSPSLTAFPRDENPAMFRAMGVDGTHTTAPADILFDPRLDVVAEWRAVDHLEEMRRQDATVEAVMHWMEDLGYTLTPQPRHRRLVSFGLTVRRVPILDLAVRGRIHPRGDEQFLVASLALQEVSTRVFDDLDRALGDRPEPSTWAELRATLERLRIDDLGAGGARYGNVLVAPPQ